MVAAEGTFKFRCNVGARKPAGQSVMPAHPFKEKSRQHGPPREPIQWGVPMPDARDGRVVLVVQEEIVTRMDAFEKAGFKVFQAGTAEEAITPF